MKTAYENNKEIIKLQEPSMSYDGGDFNSWLICAKEKLYQLIGMNSFTKVNPELEIEYEKKLKNTTEIRFTFQSESGYRVPCHLLLPDGVKNPPVMICLQGHSKGMHISLARVKYPSDEQTIANGDRDFCIRAVNEGFAAIALEQRNFGECGGSERGPGCFESAMTALLTGRTTVGERVWDVSRLIDVLESDFSDKIDVHNICCMGNSGGGTTTAYLAALEERIVMAIPSCAMCTFKDSIGAMKHCACNYVPNIAKYFDMGDIMAMSYPKYFIQVSGVDDNIFPIFGAKEVFEKGKKAYASQNLESRCNLIIGNGGHRFYADDAWPVIHQYLNK